MGHSAQATAEFLEMGGRLPPLTMIDGRAIEGYRPEELQRALDEAEGTNLPGLTL